MVHCNLPIPCTINRPLIVEIGYMFRQHCNANMGVAVQFWGVSKTSHCCVIVEVKIVLPRCVFASTLTLKWQAATRHYWRMISANMCVWWWCVCMSFGWSLPAVVVGVCGCSIFCCCCCCVASLLPLLLVVSKWSLNSQCGRIGAV